VYSEKTPDDGQRNSPKHVEFCRSAGYCKISNCVIHIGQVLVGGVVSFEDLRWVKHVDGMDITQGRTA